MPGSTVCRETRHIWLDDEHCQQLSHTEFLVGCYPSAEVPTFQIDQRYTFRQEHAQQTYS